MMQFQKWNKKSDVWSISCIIVEMITGNLYFETSDDYEHFGMMIKHSESVVFKGNDQNKKETGIQGYLLINTANKTLNTIRKGHKLQKNMYYKYEELEQVYGFDKETKTRLSRFKSYKQILQEAQQQCVGVERKMYSQLIGLLEQMFQIDPYYRITPQQALKHSFFKL